MVVPRTDRIEARDLDLQEKVVYINRVSKVVKGGRRFSFSAVVVVGDGQGHVGAGMGKANEVPEAIRKGSAIARKSLIRVPMNKTTIAHPILAHYGAAKVMMKPAAPGTGVIAGGGVRAVMESAGIKDVLTKSLGSANAINVVKATMQGLSELRDPKEATARRRASIRRTVPAVAPDAQPAATADEAQAER
jgi:small subunit ribosomal protein S5